MRTGRLAALIATAVVFAVMAVAPVLAPGAGAADDEACSSGFTIDEVFSNGARWSMCWELRILEGIVLHGVTYTPPGGSAVEVLGQANLAQIHVPYDNNITRFHDVSDYGLGVNLDDLAAEDCPGGRRLTLGTKNVLCLQVAPSGYSYKDYNDVAQGETLTLFSVSAIGAYNYIVQWGFEDDGTIRPAVGATGVLQMYGGNRANSWNVGGGNWAVAHMHDFYWRLDVDLAGAGDDRVQELASGLDSGRETFTSTRTPLLTEAARRVQPRSFRSWRVLDTVVTNEDGHRISYELVPNTDHIFRGPGYEPFTHNEFYATTVDPCERFASHNPATGGCATDLSRFVDGETLVGADLALWYGTSFHHLPRDEDEDHMDVHWSGFSLVPRDLTAVYPVP